MIFCDNIFTTIITGSTTIGVIIVIIITFSMTSFIIILQIYKLEINRKDSIIKALGSDKNTSDYILLSISDPMLHRFSQISSKQTVGSV